MKSASRWSELADQYYRVRLDWADRAFEKFRDSLLPEVRDALSKRRSDTDVVLYGTTRAGKSTLALALLGVPDDQRLTKIERILRGPLEATTESITIAPTRYVLSDGDHWTFGIGAEPARPVSEDRVQQEIVAIRAEVYALKWDPNRILNIGIPVRYAPGQDGRTLRMLDLPGVRSRKDLEGRYVEELLPSWIEAADMILLVGENHHPTFLNPAETQIDQLRNWHLLPGRFQVVMSGAYSLLTTMQRINDDVQEAGVDAWRQHMRKQLPKNAVTPDADLDRWLHPFDYAGSFRNARESYSGDAWQAVLTARNLALDELRRTLIGASRPETRIRSAYQAGRVAQQVREQRFRRLDAEVAKAERRAQTLQRSLDARRETLAAGVDSLAEHGRRQEALSALIAQADALTVPGPAPDLAKVEHDTTADFRHRLRRALKDELQFWRDKYGNAMGDYPYEASPRTQQEAVDKILTVVRERRRVGRVFASSRARLVTQVAGEYATAAQRLTELLRRRARAEAETGRETLAKKITTATSMLEAAGQGLSASERRWQRALDSAHQAVDHRAGESRKLAKAVTVAHGFPGLFVAAYEDQTQQRMTRLTMLSDRVEQLAAALAIVDAARLFDAICEDNVTEPRHHTPGQTAFDDLIKGIVREPLNEVVGQIAGRLKESLGETEAEITKLKACLQTTHQLVRTIAMVGGAIAVLLLAAVVALAVAVIS